MVKLSAHNYIFFSIAWQVFTLKRFHSARACPAFRPRSATSLKLISVRMRDVLKMVLMFSRLSTALSGFWSRTVVSMDDICSYLGTNTQNMTAGTIRVQFGHKHTKCDYRDDTCSVWAQTHKMWLQGRYVLVWAQTHKMWPQGRYVFSLGTNTQNVTTGTIRVLSGHKHTKCDHRDDTCSVWARTHQMWPQGRYALVWAQTHKMWLQIRVSLSTNTQNVTIWTMRVQSGHKHRKCGYSMF